MKTARTLAFALVAFCALFPSNGNITQAKTHVTRRIIIRPIPRRQWVQVINNVRDVKKSIGELKVGNQKSVSSMQNLRTEIHTMRGQMQAEETALVGALAVLLFLIFPVLRKSTVTEVRNTIRRNLQTNKIRNNLLSPLRNVEPRRAFAGAAVGPGFGAATVPNNFGANTAHRFTPVHAIAFVPVQPGQPGASQQEFEMAVQQAIDAQHSIEHSLQHFTISGQHRAIVESQSQSLLAKSTSPQRIEHAKTAPLSATPAHGDHNSATTQEEIQPIPPYMQHMKWELGEDEHWDVDRLMDEVFSPRNTRPYGLEDFDASREVRFDANETTHLDAYTHAAGNGHGNDPLDGVTRRIRFKS